MIRQFGVGRWIVEHHNVLITGATGVGKTYLACALGQQACRQGARVLYRRVPRLFDDLALARGNVLVLHDCGIGDCRPRCAPAGSRPPNA